MQWNRIFDGEVEDYCIQISEVSSSTDLAQENALIFPNPNNGVFDLEYTEANQYEIYNSTAELVASGTLNNSSSELKTERIELSELATGYYILKLRGVNYSEVLRFIKY